MSIGATNTTMYSCIMQELSEHPAQYSAIVHKLIGDEASSWQKVAEEDSARRCQGGFEPCSSDPVKRRLYQAVVDYVDKQLTSSSEFALALKRYQSATEHAAENGLTRLSQRCSGRNGSQRGCTVATRNNHQRVRQSAPGLFADAGNPSLFEMLQLACRSNTETPSQEAITTFSRIFSYVMDWHEPQGNAPGKPGDWAFTTATVAKQAPVLSYAY
jgi:hypothetical protein